MSCALILSLSHLTVTSWRVLHTGTPGVSSFHWVPVTDLSIHPLFQTQGYVQSFATSNNAVMTDCACVVHTSDGPIGQISELAHWWKVNMLSCWQTSPVLLPWHDATSPSTGAGRDCNRVPPHKLANTGPVMILDFCQVWVARAAVSRCCCNLHLFLQHVVHLFQGQRAISTSFL